MDKEQIRQFMTAVGSKQLQDAGEWTRGTCPLAPFLHSTGKDTNPSFGVKEELGGAHYHCFTCTSGTPESLLTTLKMYLREQPQYKDLYDLETADYILEHAALNVHSLPDFDSVGHYSKTFEPWALWFLDQFPSAVNVPKALDYLTRPKPLEGEARQPHHGRGLSVEEILKYDLRYDPIRDMVVTPFYDHYMRFAGMRGRSIEGSTHHDYTFNKSNNTQLTFFNEQVFQNDEPVIVVEGQFDVIATARVYQNTVGNLTARMSKEKLEKLASLDTVIFMLDNDLTGQRATEKAIEYLADKPVRVGVITLPQKDPDSVSEETLRKAIGELLPQVLG